ncbi:predicted protein [Micromonas commoda]|uniref:Uncharacterized protein n=1 Tax=Micromonas commoda (strain RCC299 / NOUM17 / CCMP2709) TaxID=296587 RepID=C1FH26_MICCC|nr:predicted protein [Micromonas commoda]ACO69751.1 predicted protein [Micromonas commoda]|eukprot:XP_002508493.1 predicted protein [Micromonas commoda]
MKSIIAARSSAFSFARRRFSASNLAYASARSDLSRAARSAASAARASSLSVVRRSSSRLARVRDASGMGSSPAGGRAGDAAGSAGSDSDAPPPTTPGWAAPFSRTHVSLLSIFSIRFILASEVGDWDFPGLCLGLLSGRPRSASSLLILLRTVLNDVAISSSRVGSPAGE